MRVCSKATLYACTSPRLSCSDGRPQHLRLVLITQTTSPIASASSRRGRTNVSLILFAIHAKVEADIVRAARGEAETRVDRMSLWIQNVESESSSCDSRVAN